MSRLAAAGFTLPGRSSHRMGENVRITGGRGRNVDTTANRMQMTTGVQNVGAVSAKMKRILVCRESLS